MIGYVTVTSGVTSNPASAPLTGWYTHYYSLTIPSRFPQFSGVPIKVYSGQHVNGITIPYANMKSGSSNILLFHFMSNLSTVSTTQSLEITFHAWY